MFKELFTESVEIDKNNVYHDKDTSRWGIESKITKIGSKFGKLKAVFVTADNFRGGKMAERWCFEDKELEAIHFPNPGSGFLLVRYVSLVSSAAGIANVCAISPSTGKIKLLKDYDVDPKYSKWDRPLKVQYMRVV